MKRFFNGHINFGTMASRSNDEYIDMANTRCEVRPEGLRWFCGMYDLQSTFICQAL